MQLLDYAREGWQNLCFAKLRSLLALLGVLVGTASVVAMVMGGELATNQALKEFKSLGTDLLAISINNSAESNNTQGKLEQLSLSDAEGLKQLDPHILQVAPYTQTYQPIFFAGSAINGMLLGVTDQFPISIKIQLEKGRFISTLDQYQFFCVIGQSIYKRIQQLTYQDPIGLPLQIGKQYFIIAGVAKEWPENSFVYADVNNAVMIPILSSMAISQYAAISNVLMQLAPDAPISQVEERVENHINQLLVGKQVNFRSAKELINKMKKQSQILTVFLGLIGSISLLVGGIGVMNVMLVSVMERRREIGVRLAIGARRRDIGWLFLCEAVLLSLVGGVLGVLLGVAIAFIIAWFSHWDFSVFWWPVLVGFSVSVAVGIFFGFYPAYLASKLNPIDVLRSE